MGGEGSGRYPVSQCGTAAGYRKHTRTDKQPCAACKQAWADYYRNRPRALRKPKPRKPPKNVAQRDAHAYSNALKRKHGVCAGYDLHGIKCVRQCVLGNEHHFDWDHLVPRAISGEEMISKIIKKAATYGVLDRAIAKCQLLCKFCHSDKSLGNNGKRMHADGKLQQISGSSDSSDSSEWSLFNVH